MMLRAVAGPRGKFRHAVVVLPSLSWSGRMIKSIALWALGRLRTRIKMNAQQSELWNNFIKLVTEIF